MRTTASKEQQMRTTYSETIVVQGQTAQTDRRRRYAVVAVRPQVVQVEQGTLVAFANVLSRSDSQTAAEKRAKAASQTRGAGVEIVVVDRAAA